MKSRIKMYNVFSSHSSGCNVHKHSQILFLYLRKQEFSAQQVRYCCGFDS